MLLTRLRNPLERGGIGGGVIPRFSTSFIFAGRQEGEIANIDSGSLIPKRALVANEVHDVCQYMDSISNGCSDGSQQL